MMRLVALLTLAYPLVLGGLEQTAQRQPLPVFTRLGLTPAEVAAVDKGRPVAKVLSWGEPSEVYVFGAVHITGSPDTYLKSARDIKLTLKGSEQEGLTGIKGSILRQVAVGKIRGSLESALASIKRTIEQSAPAAER